MASVASVGVQGQQGAQVATGYDAFQEIDVDDFLKLMIAELQNQDPMNPTDTADMLNQFGQMREIAANDKLTETLESVLLGQNMATAGGLIGRLVEGMTTESEKIIGQVDAVTVKNGEPQLLVAGKNVALSNVLQIIDQDLIQPVDEPADESEADDTTTDDTNTDDTA
jgi:flagellar hook assembly protein FlgD